MSSREAACEEAAKGAGVYALKAFSVLELALGDRTVLAPERIRGVQRQFHAAAQAIHRESSIFDSAFGEAGHDARSAIGAAALRHGAAVEVELSVAVTP